MSVFSVVVLLVVLSFFSVLSLVLSIPPLLVILTLLFDNRSFETYASPSLVFTLYQSPSSPITSNAVFIETSIIISELVLGLLLIFVASFVYIVLLEKSVLLSVVSELLSSLLLLSVLPSELSLLVLSVLSELFEFVSCSFFSLDGCFVELELSISRLIALTHPAISSVWIYAHPFNSSITVTSVLFFKVAILLEFIKGTILTLVFLFVFPVLLEFDAELPSEVVFCSSPELVLFSCSAVLLSSWVVLLSSVLLFSSWVVLLDSVLLLSSEELSATISA